MPRLKWRSAAFCDLLLWPERMFSWTQVFEQSRIALRSHLKDGDRLGVASSTTFSLSRRQNPPSSCHVQSQRFERSYFNEVTVSRLLVSDQRANVCAVQSFCPKLSSRLFKRSSMRRNSQNKSLLLLKGFLRNGPQEEPQLHFPRSGRRPRCWTKSQIRPPLKPPWRFLRVTWKRKTWFPQCFTPTALLWYSLSLSPC